MASRLLCCPTDISKSWPSSPRTSQTPILEVKYANRGTEGAATTLLPPYSLPLGQRHLSSSVVALVKPRPHAFACLPTTVTMELRPKRRASRLCSGLHRPRHSNVIQRVLSWLSSTALWLAGADTKCGKDITSTATISKFRYSLPLRGRSCVPANQTEALFTSRFCCVPRPMGSPVCADTRPITHSPTATLMLLSNPQLVPIFKVAPGELLTARPSTRVSRFRNTTPTTPTPRPGILYGRLLRFVSLLTSILLIHSTQGSSFTPCVAPQRKVQREVEERVLAGDPVTLTSAHLLPYTQAAILETQRLRSILPLGIPHGATQQLTVDGYRIPKGTMLLPLLWYVHHDPAIWTQPDQYRPERFIDEEGKVIRHPAFMPFQTGRRMCIGDEFAKMILFVFSTKILRHFNVSLDEGLKDDPSSDPVCGISLCPRPFQLVFHPRVEE
ncbi:cytochrome P450 monooxygenase patI-like [Homarus americanus]|uniref:cytochrome P450 monooxygenase patI-like n=1 Tax=Homarus americanus TaxID=6706 RepID=UPI001C43B3F7|nr:cytochrome P450 monooxygenase patI-like [Homarus americanus]